MQPDREHIAARWIIEQDASAFSDEQRTELAQWLMSDIDNCIAYVSIVRAWRKVAILRRGSVPLMYGKHNDDDKLPVAPDAVDAEMLVKTVGAVISRVRLGKGWSRERLAAHLKISWINLRRVERGRPPSLTTFIAIARALETLPSDLLSLAERFGTSLVEPVKKGR
jgi:DNA-binding Xre family transcriptional regulator